MRAQRAFALLRAAAQRQCMSSGGAAAATMMGACYVSTAVLLLLLRPAAGAFSSDDTVRVAARTGDSSGAPPGRCGSAPCAACTIQEGNYTCSDRGFPSRGYTFHVSDTLCPSGNDPNGVFYDPRHGVYHMGWQMHLVHHGCGTVQWGHMVSADFVTWAELPPSIWSGGVTAGGFKYDNVSIFSGSATVGSDGVPRMVYPGMCASACAHGHMHPPTDCYEECKTGFSYGLVVPANLSDPLYTEWTKTAVDNPIVNNTGLDPSSAWQTKSGEWRFVGNGRAEATGCPGNATLQTTPIYGSMDLVTFYKIGCTSLPAGDCPTLFPRPPLAPGSTEGLSEEALASLPTHVYKCGWFESGDPTNPDTCWFGDLTDGKPGPEGKGTVGSWTQKGTSQNIAAASTTHSMKDFWDPVHKRRVAWVWIQRVGSGTQTVPREVTFDARSQQLVFTPARELKQLRTHLISAITQPAEHTVQLNASGASDSELWFARPDSSGIVLNVAAGGTVLSANLSSDAMQFCQGPAQNKQDPSKPPPAPQCVRVPLYPTDEALDMRVLADGDIMEVYVLGGRGVLTFQGYGKGVGSISIGASKQLRLLNASAWAMGGIKTSVEDVLSQLKAREAL
jgi:sucrose-6-phosphate hydrolase SacC (GH32 family)